MRRSSDDHDAIPGEDSFLDIIANIVGILVLLTVVVGLRAAQVSADEVMSEPLPERSVELAENAVEADEASRIAAEEALRFARQAGVTANEADALDHDRTLFATEIETLRRDLEQQREGLDARQQDQLALRTELASLEQQLNELTIESVSLTSSDTEPETETITHDTASLAGARVKEYAILIVKETSVAYAPIKELLQLAKQRLRSQINDLAPGQAVEEVVGPIDGHRLRYRYVTRQIATREGMAIQTSLAGYRIEPDPTVLRETYQQAFRPGSRTLARLAALDPQKTAITLAVCPDSFGDDVELKKRLTELGFRVAVATTVQDGSIQFGSDGQTPRL